MCDCSISRKVTGSAVDFKAWFLEQHQHHLECEFIIRNADSQVPPRPPMSETRGLGPSWSSQWLWCALKCENHWAGGGRKLQLYRGFYPANNKIQEEGGEMQPTLHYITIGGYMWKWNSDYSWQILADKPVFLPGHLLELPGQQRSRVGVSWSLHQLGRLHSCAETGTTMSGEAFLYLIHPAHGGFF